MFLLNKDIYVRVIVICYFYRQVSSNTLAMDAHRFYIGLLSFIKHDMSMFCWKVKTPTLKQFHTKKKIENTHTDLLSEDYYQLL